MHRRGFFLIDPVFTVLTLGAVVLFSVNPTRQLSDAKDAQRRSDVNTILNATYQYAIDHNGALPAGIPLHSTKEICINREVTKSCVDLSPLLDIYLVGIPTDPDAKAGHTGYYISQDEGGRVTVATKAGKGAKKIHVTR